MPTEMCFACGLDQRQFAQLVRREQDRYDAAEPGAYLAVCWEVLGALQLPPAGVELTYYNHYVIRRGPGPCDRGVRDAHGNECLSVPGRPVLPFLMPREAAEDLAATLNMGRDRGDAV